MSSYGAGKITQEERILKLKTPLGADFLLIQSIELVEEISRLPHAKCVVLHEEAGPGFEPTPLNVPALLGQIVAVRFQTVDGTTRFYNGIVNRCSQSHRDLRYTYYDLEIVPMQWMLTQRQDSRIFQHVTIPKILETVLKDYPFELQLGTVDWKPRNYVTQYRESDFDFISRLMEEEGIFYYFTHTEDEHKMIICVDTQSHIEIPSEPAEIPYFIKIEEENFVPHIYSFSVQYKLLPGKVTLWDHSFQKPSDNFAVSQPSRFLFGTNDGAEQYLFPSDSIIKHDVIDASQGEKSDELQYMTDDIKRSVEIFQQSIDVEHRVIKATGNCCSFTAGHKFKLFNYPNKDMNGSYVITKVRHVASQLPMYDSDMEDGGYLNDCECIPWGEKAVPFRPARVTPQPMILSSQTATVVGPAGEEIYTDKYGRVKVQFHWDRQGSFDQGSSCWARVSQHWAGNKWGSMFIPRIGMEVLIHFLEGDPDKPIITGCVYNNDSMPAYELPDQKTKSGVKSDSTIGGKGFNEFRFEDKKGSEQVFIHGEKDIDIRVKNDRREWIGNDRSLIVHRDKLDLVERDEHRSIKRDRVQKIDRDRHEKVGGKATTEVSNSLSLKVGGDVAEKFGANHAEDTAGAIYIKAGSSIVLEAGVQISLKVGGNFVDIGPSGVTIVGTMVMINSGGAAGTGSAGSIVPPMDPVDAQIADNADPGSKAPTYKNQQQAIPPNMLPSFTQPSHKPNSPANEQKKSWIEIVLKDSDGNPVPGERYRVTLPDGTTLDEGTLDDKGFARVDNIDPGNCKVTFPRLDGRTWRPE